MTPDNPFEANLDAIERAIARVCRDARLARADAEDFASSARIALLADDCSILRRFEGRSSLATYVTVVRSAAGSVDRLAPHRRKHEPQ